MGELTDRAKGAANKVAGGLKSATGKATDNDNLRAKGDAQQSKGKAQKVIGKVKGALGDDV